MASSQLRLGYSRNELVARMAEKTPKANAHGGDRSKQADNVRLKGEYGNNAKYLTSVIARDRPDILERMKKG